MKKTKLIIFLLTCASIGFTALAPAQVPFDDFFHDQTLRIDLYQAGDAKEETLTIHQIYLEGTWPESKAGLISPFDYGRYVYRLYDIASNRLIFSRGFDTMFAEYKTTAPALACGKRVFQRSVRLPFPKRPVLFVVERRDKRHLLHPLFDQIIDPTDYHIIRETPSAGDTVYEVQLTGDPQSKVDFVFLAEGYTAAEQAKFKSDLDRMTAFLFSVEPYKSLKDRFNIRGVFRPSAGQGMDEPRQSTYKKTVLNASFNAFDLDRYMLIEEDHRMHEIAGQVPYDAIIVLVNSRRYGGGSIGLDYCVSTVDHPTSPQVLIHELGHSFAYLADEYYQAEVSYNDFFPKGVEPLEPNITALLDPARVKWKDLLAPGIAVPTEYGKEEIEALQAERQKNRQAQARDTEDAKKRKASAKEMRRIEERYRKADGSLTARIEGVRSRYAEVYDKVGVFEGAGYASKGLFRPMVYCLMISSPKGEFCLVCQQAIAQMIDFYSGKD